MSELETKISDKDIMIQAFIDAQEVVNHPKAPTQNQYESNGGHGQWIKVPLLTVDRVGAMLFEHRMASLKRGQASDEWVPSGPDFSVELQKMLGKAVEKKAEALLKKELGDEAYASFIKDGNVTLIPQKNKNYTKYTLYNDGTINMLRADNTPVVGKIALAGYGNAYQKADSFATIIKWLKNEPEHVDDIITQHCGNIVIQGGEPK